MGAWLVGVACCTLALASHVACDNESAREGAYGSFVRVQGCPPASSAWRRAAGEGEEGGTMRVRHQSLPVEQRCVAINVGGATDTYKRS